MRSLPTCAALLALTLLAARPAAAGGGPAPDLPGARMTHLLEKTIMKVDVATATVTVDPAAAVRLSGLVAGRKKLDRDVEDALAAALFAHVAEANAEIRFHVGIGKERYVESRREALEKAREGGHIDRATERRLAAGLAERFAWMDDEGVREGDILVHELRGDTLHSRYVAADGTVRHEGVGTGPEVRPLLLAGLFGTKAEFRRGLLASLLDPAE